MKTNLFKLLLTATLLVSANLNLHAQGTAFTYQGRLGFGGIPANGLYDMTFAVFTTNVTGTALAGPTPIQNVAVSNGLFIANVDLGTGVFSGPDRWLEIYVRTNGGGRFTTLAPRQPLTPSPYAIFANTASNLVGTLPAAQITGPIAPANIAPGTITSGMLAPGAISMLGAPDGSPTNAVQVDNNGLVGIGTTTPAAGLQITSGANITTLPVLFEVQNGQRGWTNIYEVVSAAVKGNLLAVGGHDGVTIASITNPASPTLLSQVARGSGGLTNFIYITSLAWSGSNLVAMASGAMSGDVRALNILSCTNPANPVKLAELRDGMNGFNNLSYVTDLATSGNLLAIAGMNTNYTDVVSLADLSNPSVPVQKCAITNGFGGFTNLYAVSSLAFRGNLLAIAAENGVTLVDVSDPTNPIKLAELRNGVGGYTNWNSVSSVSISGNLLAVASFGSYTVGTTFVTLVDISNPASPVKSGEIRDGWGGYSIDGARSVILSANRMVISADYPGTVTLVDVSNPLNPLLLATDFSGQNGADYLVGPKLTFAGTNIVACGFGSGFALGVTILGVVEQSAGLVSSGWVGIGTTQPSAALDVVGDVLFENATLFNANAKRVALGYNAIASGAYSTALGPYATALGDGSIALGQSATASGYAATALGEYTTASGGGANAQGVFTTASGDISTAMGFYSVASGEFSTALGYYSVAAGANSTAMGNLANAAHNNTFVWADGSATNGFATTSSNQFLLLATGGVGINTNVTYGSALTVSGNTRITGLIRTGSETGTSQAPNPAGLVVRRINSTLSISNSIVALAHTIFLGAGTNINLVRDGTAGGFQIQYPALPGYVTIACMGIDTNGVTKNFYVGKANPSTPGTVQIFTDAQAIVHFECTFGDTYNSGDHLTRVTLSRFYNGSVLDNYWSGDLVSTYNQ